MLCHGWLGDGQGDAEQVRVQVQRLNQVMDGCCFCRNCEDRHKLQNNPRRINLQAQVDNQADKIKALNGYATQRLERT